MTPAAYPLGRQFPSNGKTNCMESGMSRSLTSRVNAAEEVPSLMWGYFPAMVRSEQIAGS
jgi:hypothetical protein